MRILTVYIKDSHYRYPGLFEDFIYAYAYGPLEIYERDKITGDEILIAAFKSWDYLIVDKVDDE